MDTEFGIRVFPPWQNDEELNGEKWVKLRKNSEFWLSGVFFSTVAVALLAGFYWRLVDLGTWPLAVDEFYIARSVEFILERGVPEFPFGGYYTRGLAYQYLAALFISAGANAELVLRALSVMSSLIVLPAVFFVARDASGRRVAWIIVVILALSTWQIEMARFGRMYAPFQALFVWYLYHMYFLVIRGETWRWKWLIAFTLLGPLIWEGGIFLAVLNFIPFCLRFFRPTWVWLPVCFILLGITLWISQLDFRAMSHDPGLPEELYRIEGGSRLANLLPSVEYLKFAFNNVEGLLFLVLCSLSLGYCAWRLLNHGALPWFSRIGLVILSIFAITQQLMFTAVTLVFLIAAGWIRLKEWHHNLVRFTLIVNAAVILGWILLFSVVWGNGLLTTLKVMLAVPNFWSKIIIPSVKVMPDLTVLLAGLIGFGVVLLFFREKRIDEPLSLVVVLSLSCLTLVAIAPIFYIETRYFFFAYPLLLITGLIVVKRLITRSNGFIHSLHTGILIIPILFLFSTDFHFSHLKNIGSYHANFRVGYPRALIPHYYQRHDHRAPGEFVDARASEGDVVITSITPVSAYISRIDAIYLNKKSPRYRNQAYVRGEVERWTSAKLLATRDEVEDFLQSHDSRTWFIVCKGYRCPDWERELVELLELNLEFTTKDDAIEVYSWKPPN